MEISPFIFLIVYVLVVGIFVFMGLLNIYHIIRFSHLRPPSIIISLLFLVVTVGIVLGTFAALRDVVWDRPLDLRAPFTNTISNTINEGF